MNKKDMTVLGAVGEALGILLVAGYLAIQIFYGVSYHIPHDAWILSGVCESAPKGSLSGTGEKGYLGYGSH